MSKGWRKFPVSKFLFKVKNNVNGVASMLLALESLRDQLQVSLQILIEFK